MALLVARCLLLVLGGRVDVTAAAPARVCVINVDDALSAAAAVPAGVLRPHPPDARQTPRTGNAPNVVVRDSRPE